MTLTIASFLAGSLLSMLMPVLLLIALVFLIHWAAMRVTAGDREPARRATQGEHASPAASSDPAVSQPTGDPPVREL